MPRTISVAALQTSYGDDLQANIAKTDRASSARPPSKGAQVILPSELFQGPYFCVTQEERLVRHRPSVARASVRDRPGPAGQASWAWPSRSRSSSARARTISTRLVMLDADGEAAGRLPQEPHPRRPRLSGEVLFPPRRHGLPVWDTRFGRIGVGICWDQWYPETRARHDADGRRGADLPHRHRLGAARPVAGHRRAVAPRHAGPRRLQRRCPVVGANRTGLEPRLHRRRARPSTAPPSSPTTGAIWSTTLGRDDEGVLVHELRPGFPGPPPRRLGLLPRPPHGPVRRPDRQARLEAARDPVVRDHIAHGAVAIVHAAAEGMTGVGVAVAPVSLARPDHHGAGGAEP